MFKRHVSSLEQAEEAIRIFKEIPIRLLDVDLSASIKIAHDLGIYAYDAYLIDVSIRHNAPIVSLDKHLLDLAEKWGAKVLRVR